MQRVDSNSCDELNHAMMTAYQMFPSLSEFIPSMRQSANPGVCTRLTLAASLSQQMTRGGFCYLIAVILISIYHVIHNCNLLQTTRCVASLVMARKLFPCVSLLIRKYDLCLMTLRILLFKYPHTRLMARVILS